MAKFTAAESRYADKVQSLGCLICDQPANIHHIREGQGVGQRAGNCLIIPLCQQHHQGSFSIHGSRRQFIDIYGNELSMLNETIRRVSEL